MSVVEWPIIFSETDIWVFRVFDAKRLIGRKFSDAEVQADLKHFPFKVIDKGGKPSIQVEYRGETKTFVSLIISIWTGPRF